MSPARPPSPFAAIDWRRINHALRYALLNGGNLPPGFMPPRSVAHDTRATPAPCAPHDHHEANEATHGTADRSGVAEGAETISEPRALEIQIRTTGTRWQFCTRLASDRDEAYGLALLERFRADKEMRGAHPNAEYRLVRTTFEVIQ